MELIAPVLEWRVSTVDSLHVHRATVHDSVHPCLTTTYEIDSVNTRSEEYFRQSAVGGDAVR